MKIIHCGDLHLDAKMETHFNVEQARERRYEILGTFERMVEYGRANGVSLILIAGDMFDTVASSQRRIKDRVLEIITSHEDIDFLYLQGNHDSDTYFKSLAALPANLKLFDGHWTSYRYGDVVVSGVEFGKETTPGIYDLLSLDHDMFNIVMLHGQVTSNRNSLESGMVNIPLLKDRGIDYLALGHLHDYRCESLDGRGVYCYCGALEGRGFDETGKKGFVVLDIADKQLDYQFVSLARREFHIIPVALDGCLSTAQALDLVEQAIEKGEKDDCVRIILEGRVDENFDLDLDYLSHQLKDRFYFVELINRIRLDVDYRKFANDISLKGEFIRTVEALDLDEPSKNRIIMMGLNALLHKEVIS